MKYVIPFLFTILTALPISAASISPDSASRTSSGRMSPGGASGFNCDTPVGSTITTCTCSGYLDCRNMEKKKCGVPTVISCESPVGGGKETCSCEFEAKKSSNKTRWNKLTPAKQIPGNK
jgi:hypothetical protein